MFTRLRLAVVVLGLAIAFAASIYVPPVAANRNGAGTYSLPSGNPVVSGATISSSWANSTLNDIASELTNSLDRGGRGAMTQALQHSTGSCANPSVTFSADPDVGLWRSSTNEMAACIATNSVQRWTTTGVVFPLAAAVTGATTLSGGLTVTQSSSNTAGAVITGNGSGNGITATGGASGTGIVSTGGASGGVGVTGTGTSSFRGMVATGGPTNGTGIDAIGGGSTGLGIYAVNGGGASATLNAAKLDGLLYLSGGNPGSGTAFTNQASPANQIKAWGFITTPGDVPTVSGGFNVTSAATNGNCITITIASAFANTNYSVTVTAGAASSGEMFNVQSRSTTAFDVCATTPGVSGGTDTVNLHINSNSFSFQVVGLQ